MRGNFGARSVKNDLIIKEKFNFQQSAKDILITSELRSAMIFNKKIKAVNYQIDTYKKTIYVYGISQNEDERDEIIKEAKEILDVKDVVTSILMVDDLKIKKRLIFLSIINPGSRPQRMLNLESLRG